MSGIGNTPDDTDTYIATLETDLAHWKNEAEQWQKTCQKSAEADARAYALLQAERDQLFEKLEQLAGEAAAMRTVLESATPDSGWRGVQRATPAWWNLVNAALSSTAGADLLKERTEDKARIGELEAFVRLFAVWPCWIADNIKLFDGVMVGVVLSEHIRQARRLLGLNEETGEAKG